MVSNVCIMINHVLLKTKEDDVINGIKYIDIF